MGQLTDYIRSGSQMPGGESPVERIVIGLPGTPTELIIYQGRIYVYDTEGQSLIDGGYLTARSLEAVIMTVEKLALNAQKYINNIPFQAVDNDTCNWGAGSIIFADGTVIDINSGGTTVAAVTYVYYNGSSPTLQTTTQPATATGGSNIPLAIIEPVTAGEGKCLITPFVAIGTTINGDTITTGKIQSANGKTYFDLNNNVLALHDGYTTRLKLGKMLVPSILDSYSESYCNGSGGIYGASQWGKGQSFYGDGGVLHKLVFYLLGGGTPPGYAYAKIYAHAGVFGTSSVPTGSPIAVSEPFLVSMLSTSTSLLIPFVFKGANRITLADDVPYVATIEYASGDGSNLIYVGSNYGSPRPSPDHPGNMSQVSGGVWSASSTNVLNYYIYTSKSTYEYGIKLTLPEYDVDEDSDLDRYALYAVSGDSEDNVLIKEKTRGSTSVGASSHTHIAHGLGYAPFVIVFVEESAYKFTKCGGEPIDSRGFYFGIDSTNLTLYNTTGGAKTFKYYIFYDRMF